MKKINKTILLIFVLNATIFSSESTAQKVCPYPIVNNLNYDITILWESSDGIVNNICIGPSPVLQTMPVAKTPARVGDEVPMIGKENVPAIKIYPNPTRGKFTIETEPGRFKIRIYDQVGTAAYEGYADGGSQNFD